MKYLNKVNWVTVGAAIVTVAVLNRVAKKNAHVQKLING